MDKPSPVTKRELRRSLMGIILIVLVISGSSLLLVTSFWYIWPMILVISMVVIAYSTVSKKTWRCPSCGTTFKISVLQDLLAFHGLEKRVDGRYYEWKRLRCPSCEVRSRSYPVEDDNMPPKS